MVDCIDSYPLEIPEFDSLFWIVSSLVDCIFAVIHYRPVIHLHCNRVIFVLCFQSINGGPSYMLRLNDSCSENVNFISENCQRELDNVCWRTVLRIAVRGCVF